MRKKSATPLGFAAMFVGSLLLVLSPAQGSGQEGHQQREWPPPNSVVQAHLDSMQVVALTSPDVDERAAAIIGILAIGRFSEALPGEPYPGVVQRLRTIYEQEPTYGLRAHIVRWLEFVGERAERLEFLRMVASERRADEDAEDFPVPLLAVGKLARMGAEGRAVLQQLAAQDAVKNPVARVQLKRLQEQGWEPRPPR